MGPFLALFCEGSNSVTKDMKKADHRSSAERVELSYVPIREKEEIISLTSTDFGEDKSEGN